MKTRDLLIALILFFCNTLLSQTNPFYETVYLKNGSQLKGIITEWVPNETITLKLVDGSIFVFKISEINKVTRNIEEIKTSKNITAESEMIFEPKEYNSQISLGYGAAGGKYGLNVIGYNWVYGKNLKPKHYIGGGTGVRYYFYRSEEGSITMIPIFIDYQYRINNEKFSPYVKVAGGYSLNIESGFDNSGFLFNPRLGVDFSLGKSSIFMDIGYHTQQMSFGVIKDPISGSDIITIWDNSLKDINGLGGYYSKVYRFSESININLGFSF